MNNRDHIPDTFRKSFLLFSGFNHRAIVAFCRELEGCGLGLSIVALNSADLIFKTRYKKYVVATRTKQELDPDDLARCIQAARRSSGAEKLVVCPTSEFLNVYALNHREFFEANGCEIPLVERSLYELVSNKHSCSELCRARGLKVARRIDRPDQATYPFVAKPGKNISAAGKTLYPHLIFNPEDLAQFRRQESEADFYFEEFVSGASCYLLFHLAKDGRVVKFSQQNQLQQPGGKSIVLARAAAIHHRPVADRFVELLKAVGFHGLVMIEVKGDGDDWTFIEMNPRFWGPLQLVTDSGSDIVRAFIGESLFDDAGRFSPRPVRDGKSYLWLNGVCDSLFSGRRLAWHVPPPGCKFWYVLRHLFCDVYLRPDTIRLFWHELIGSIRRSRRGSGQ